MSSKQPESIRDHQALLSKVNPTPLKVGRSQSSKPRPSLPWGHEFRLKEIAFCQARGHIISHRLTLNLLVYEDESDLELSQWTELSISEGEIIGLSSRDLVLTLMKHLIAQNLINQSDAEVIIKQVLHQSSSQSQVDDFVEAILEIAPYIIDQLDEIMELVLIKQVYRLFELSQGFAKTLTYQRLQDVHHFTVRPARLLIDGVRESMSKLRLYKLFGTPKVMPSFDNIALYMDSSMKLSVRYSRRSRSSEC